MKKKFALTMAAIVFLGGCSGKKGSSSEVEKNKDIPEITDEKLMSVEKAHEILAEKLHNYGLDTPENFRLVFDCKSEDGDGYIFHGYEDHPDHVATTGWYQVEVKTGQCQEITTEPVPLAYDIEITENGLDIYRRHGELLQQIPLNTYDIYPEYKKNGNAYDFVIVNDLNFDGYDDLSVVAVVGEDTNIYQYFLYDPDSSQFAECSTLDAMYYLAVPDPESQTISVESWNGTAAAYNSVYHWQDERLMPVSAQSRYIQDNETYIDYFEYDQDGVETLVKRERLILDSSGVPTGESEEVSIESEE